jgi:bifunctional DNA-binding transcriptional regulator/antitoxin component of YhaV-PrlF toxin-antitoxin module
MRTNAKVTRSGGFTVPKYFRNMMSLEPGEVLELNINTDGVLEAKRATPRCAVCDESNDVVVVGPVAICGVCTDEVVRKHERLTRYRSFRKFTGELFKRHDWDAKQATVKDYEILYAALDGDTSFTTEKVMALYALGQELYAYDERNAACLRILQAVEKWLNASVKVGHTMPSQGDYAKGATEFVHKICKANSMAADVWITAIGADVESFISRLEHLPANYDNWAAVRLAAEELGLWERSQGLQKAFEAMQQWTLHGIRFYGVYEPREAWTE